MQTSRVQIRSYSWRHNWKYVPIWRTWIMAFGVVYILIFHVLPGKLASHVPPHSLTLQ